MAGVWGNSWGASWGASWAEAILPPVPTLLLGTIAIGPALAAEAFMRAALADAGITARPLLAGLISTDRSD